jgi:hypothetical protein
MEIVLKTVKIAGTFPFTHRKIMKQIVAARLRLCGRHFFLCENPLEALDG